MRRVLRVRAVAQQWCCFSSSPLDDLLKDLNALGAKTKRKAAPTTGAANFASTPPATMETESGGSATSTRAADALLQAVVDVADDIPFAGVAEEAEAPGEVPLAKEAEELRKRLHQMRVVKERLQWIRDVLGAEAAAGPVRSRSGDDDDARAEESPWNELKDSVKAHRIVDSSYNPFVTSTKSDRFLAMTIVPPGSGLLASYATKSGVQLVGALQHLELFGVVTDVRSGTTFQGQERCLKVTVASSCYNVSASNAVSSTKSYFDVFLHGPRWQKERIEKGASVVVRGPLGTHMSFDTVRVKPVFDVRVDVLDADEGAFEVVRDATVVAEGEARA